MQDVRESLGSTFIPPNTRSTFIRLQELGLAKKSKRVKEARCEGSDEPCRTIYYPVSYCLSPEQSLNLEFPIVSITSAAIQTQPNIPIMTVISRQPSIEFGPIQKIVFRNTWYVAPISSPGPILPPSTQAYFTAGAPLFASMSFKAKAPLLASISLS